MAAATTTQDFRERWAAYFAGGAVPPRPAYMAFGDGGHLPDGSAKAADNTQTALQNELTRIELDSVSQEDALSFTGSGVLGSEDLVGSDLSEGGLIDASGNLMAFRNFAKKTKDTGEEYELKIKIKL